MKSKKIIGFFVELVIYVALILACIFIVPEYVLQRTVVQGESMEPALHTAESLLVEKLSMRFTDLERYDIIVFSPHGSKDEYYVKRVFGLPGETIQIINDEIFINDEKILDNYRKSKMFGSGIAQGKITLGEDEYFVLGDNREVSLDSREESLGPIHKGEIEGKAMLRIWPLDKFGTP